MGRFFVFAGYDYEPGGGWDDHVAICATLEEAQSVLAAHLQEALIPHDWWHIVDMDTGEIVERGWCSA